MAIRPESAKTSALEDVVIVQHLRVYCGDRLVDYPEDEGWT
jgi:hypothetical protein